MKRALQIAGIVGILFVAVFVALIVAQNIFLLGFTVLAILNFFAILVGAVYGAAWLIARNKL